jgi:polysaccharide export outer membrane protein
LKYLLLILVTFFCCAASVFADNTNPPDQPSILPYKLAPGDLLEVSVWKEEDLQKQVIIAPDGNISLPLADTIMAAGKTIPELRGIIRDKLNNYIADPAVNVALIKNDGNSIFVIGKVNKPGQYLANRHIDVLQALSLAGGLTVFANESSIHIIRRTASEVKVFPFDYDDVLDGEKLEQNIILEPGDTVTVR